MAPQGKSMGSHTLRLTYEGLLAADHKMPTSLQKKITAGAQEFLGSHAYFFTEGRIPTNVNDRSQYFHIHDLRQRDGSWEAIFTIDLANVATEFVKEYVRELTKNLAVEAALATKIGFLYLIHRSYKAWQERRPLTDTVFDRIEPVLVETQGNGSPLYDLAIECERQRRILFDRTDSSMSKISAPIGRTATHVDVWFDEQKLDHIQRRFIAEEEITAVVLSMREQMNLGQRVRRPGH
jgi:hypothetical protein